MSSPTKTRDAIILIVALILPTAITWMYFVGNKDSSAQVQQIVYGVGKLAQFLLPLVAVWMATDRSFSFHWPKMKGMALGTAFGIAVVGLMFGIYFFRMVDHPMLEDLKVNILSKVTGFGVNAPWKFFVMGAWYTIFHSLFEEYYWRWFVFPQCQRFFSLWPSVVISSLGFMLHHVLVLGVYLGWDNLFTYQLSASIAIGGAFWAWLYHKTESLYPAWLSHAIVDAGLFTMGYLIVKDSL